MTESSVKLLGVGVALLVAILFAVVVGSEFTNDNHSASPEGQLRDVAARAPHHRMYWLGDEFTVSRDATVYGTTWVGLGQTLDSGTVVWIVTLLRPEARFYNHYRVLLTRPLPDHERLVVAVEKGSTLTDDDRREIESNLQPVATASK